MQRHAAIAVGAVSVAAAVAVAEFRMDGPWADGVLLVVALVPAAVALAVGLRERPDGDRPTAATSALLLAGLALFAIADARLLELLTDDDALNGPRSLTAFFAIFAVMAAVAAARSRSAACLLVSALALGGTVLAAVWWIFDTENVASYRPALLGLALAFAAGAFLVRGRSRDRDVLVDAAGLALVGMSQIAGGFFIFLGSGALPDFWEGVLFAGVVALVAYTAVTHAPGPGVIGAVLLVSFVSIVSVNPALVLFGEESDEPSLVGWPLILLALGGLALAYGLRRRDEHAPPPEDPTDVTREVRL